MNRLVANIVTGIPASAEVKNPEQSEGVLTLALHGTKS